MILDYYLDYLKRSKRIYKKIPIDTFIGNKDVVNRHIYLNDLKNKITIVSEIDNYEEFAVGSILNAKNEYYIFYTDVCLLDNKYTILVKNSYDIFTLAIYNDLFFSNSFTFNELKLFLDWINIDELTNKVNDASSYIYFMLSKIDNETVDDEPIYMNISSIKYDKRLYNDIDAYVRFVCQYTLYDICDKLFIYDQGQLHFEGYVNRFTHNLITKASSGELDSYLYYFSIDEYRSIIIYNSSRHMGVMFLKDSEIIRIGGINPLLDLLMLISKKDIYDFLKKVDMFRNNTWKEYIDNSSMHKLKLCIKNIYKELIKNCS